MKQTDRIKQIGIDFGTSTTEISHVVEGALTPEFFRIGPAGTEILPSVIAFRRNGKTLFGREADNAVNTDNCMVFRSIKRSLVAGQEQATHDVFGKTMTNEEIAHEFLAEAFRRTVRYGSQDAARAVIGCPTDAGRAYREFARTGLTRNGFEANTLRDHVLEEPALSAYAMRRLESLSDGKCVLIYDFGGGTFDTALAQIEVDLLTGRRSVNLIYAAGDLKLGGDDIDHAVLKAVLPRLVPGLEANLTQAQHSDLLHVCRDAKVTLSDEESVTILPPVSLAGVPGAAEVELTRSQLNEIAAPFWKRSTSVLDRLARGFYAVARNARGRNQTLKTLVDDEVVHTVICVGGTTRMPYFREQLESVFGKQRVMEYDVIPPEQAVAAGAALATEDVTATSVRLAPFACSAMLFDKEFNLVRPPRVVREAYSSVTGFTEAFVNGVPGGQETIALPTNARHVVFRFSHADEPLPDASTCWEHISGDTIRVCNKAWAEKLFVFIGANGEVRLRLDDGEPECWEAPWAAVGKSDRLLASEERVKAGVLEGREVWRKTFHDGSDTIMDVR